MSELTERQKDVFSLANAGLTNRQIADELGITRNAVRFHLKEIHSKLETEGDRLDLRGRLLSGAVWWIRLTGALPIWALKVGAGSATAGVVGILGLAVYLAADNTPNRDELNQLPTTTYHSWPGATLEKFTVPGRVTIDDLERLNPSLSRGEIPADAEVIVPVLPGARSIHAAPPPG